MAARGSGLVPSDRREFSCGIFSEGRGAVGQSFPGEYPHWRGIPNSFDANSSRFGIGDSTNLQRQGVGGYNRHAQQPFSSERRNRRRYVPLPAGDQNKNTVKNISITITVIVAIFFAITAASIGFQYMNYAYSKLFLNMSLAKRAAIFSGVAGGLGVGLTGTIIAVTLAFFGIVKCVCANKREHRR